MFTKTLLERSDHWSYTVRYMLYGALFGCCFPVVATWLELVVQGLPATSANILWVQARQPLYWIIDTAPLFLGLFASLAGRRQDLLARLNAQLELRMNDRVAALARANQELESEIVERKRAEVRLRASEARKDAILESALDCIITIDHEGRVLEFNPAAEKTFGYTRTDVLGEPMAELIVPPALREQHHQGLQRYLATGAGPVLGKRIEITAMRADGTEFPVELAIVPILLEEQPVFTAYLRDITQRKAVERLKDELVSTVSHELRTPLTSLRGFAELLLKRDFTPQKQREFLSIIQGEAVRLTNLINDFLDLQRMESGRQVYDFAHVDLESLLRETLAVFIPEEEKHTLRLQLSAALPAVHVDADRLRQVLVNLLSNALKFSPHGGEVTVGARQEGADVVVWVADQGIGMTADGMQKLFTKFYRVDNAETRSIGGSGLGLALAKAIIEAHKGRVWVESAVGKGSTFFFSLPAVAAEPHAAVPAAATNGATDILLVEDDQAYASLLREYFESAGLSVTITGYAEHAWELMRVAAPRLALVDIHLAGRMDGWDLVVALRNDPTLRSIPVIISTNSETNDHGLAFAGAEYLQKPISSQSLIEDIRRRLPALSCKHVLVVDDDATFRSQLTAFLSAQEGIRVEQAADGREALAHMAHAMPDLLILDLFMPEMDGFEVLHRLRADKHAANLPVLVVTGKDLLPSEQTYLDRRLASLASKKEASPDSLVRMVVQTLRQVRTEKNGEESPLH